MAIYVNPASSSSEEDQRIAAQTIADEHKRLSRLKRKFITQATPWAPGKASVPFQVIIDDLSENAASLLVERPLDVGLPLLLTVPVGEDGHTKVRQFTVARCTLRHDSQYAVGLEIDATPARNPAAPKRVCSQRLKILFLLFGIFGLIIAAFAPLGN